MENVNSKNNVVPFGIKKVVEYEVITTKKFRQVVKVQFDDMYSDKLNESKITPSDLDFGIGEEIDGNVSFKTKVVRETPDKFMTFSEKDSLSWGRVVPFGTQSVLTFGNSGSRGFTNSVTIYLNCPLTIVEDLWSNSNIIELSTYIIDFDCITHPRLSTNKDGTHSFECDSRKHLFENGSDCLKTIHKKRNGNDITITVFEVGHYQRTEDLNSSGFKSDESTIVLNCFGTSKKEYHEYLESDEYREREERILNPSFLSL